MVRNGPLGHLAARRWSRRPLQYLLCILGIALGVAMLVSIDLASDSAQRAFSLSTDAITGRPTHRLVAIGPGGMPDTTFVALRHHFPEIPAAPVIEAYGRAEELDGELLRVVGVDLFSEAPFRGLLGGGSGGGRGFVPFLSEPRTAVIATETAERFDLHPGAGDASGILHLDLAGRTSALRLVGSVSCESSLERRGLETLLEQTNGSLRQGSLVIFDRTFAITGALQLLTLVVAFIGIFSTLMSLPLERGLEFAVLRATGMTPRQLGRLTLLEPGLMGLLHAPGRRAGLGAGACDQRALLHPVAAGRGGAALLAGLYPAQRLGRMTISEALRQE